jgi:hypothetical protein
MVHLARPSLLLLLLLLLGLSAGCSQAGGGDDEAGPDAAPFGDFETDGGVQAACTAPAALPPGLLTGAAATRSAELVAVFRSAQPSPPFDVYQLELWTGVAPFAGPIVPGTYAIEGAQTDYATCGLCLLLMGDTDEAGFARQQYVADSGVVTIDSVDQFSITGTISEVSMVSFNNGEPGRCRTFVGGTPFAAPIQPR